VREEVVKIDLHPDVSSTFINALVVISYVVASEGVIGIARNGSCKTVLARRVTQLRVS
jgi:hypothetical protein